MTDAEIRESMAQFDDDQVRVAITIDETDIRQELKYCAAHFYYWSDKYNQAKANLREAKDNLALEKARVLVRLYTDGSKATAPQRDALMVLDPLVQSATMMVGALEDEVSNLGAILEAIQRKHQSCRSLNAQQNTELEVNRYAT